MHTERTGFALIRVRTRLPRRRVLRGLGAVGMGAAALGILGCRRDGSATRSGSGAATDTGGGKSGEGPKRGGVLRAGLGNTAPVSFDMHQEIFFYSLWPTTMMYNQLLKFDQYKMDNIIGDLSSSWEIQDGTNIVFKLHEATFHDGTPLTSADVKASIERIKTPPQRVRSPRQGQFQVLSSIETPDNRTVVLKLSQPSASFLGSLAHMNVAMYATKDLNNPEWHKQNVNGTGPFMLERVDTGTLVVLKKNPKYFHKDLPYLDGWEWHIIPEAVANLAAFRSGNLDMFGPAVTDYEALKRIANTTLLHVPGTTWYATTIATQKRPWNDPRVWKAIGLAISKQDFNQVQNLGQGGIGGPVPPGTSWSLSEKDLLNVPGYKGLGNGAESSMEVRWAEARKLLDATGIASGTPVQILSWSGFENWATTFKDGLERVGLRPQLNLVELGTYNERLAARDFGDMAANSRTAVFPDPTPVFADNYIKGAGRHYTDLVVPEVEELFGRQDSELDTNRRQELQHRMQVAYLEAYPAEIYGTTVTDTAFYDHVKDYGVEYPGLFQARKHEEIWLNKP